MTVLYFDCFYLINCLTSQFLIYIRILSGESFDQGFNNISRLKLCVFRPQKTYFHFVFISCCQVLAHTVGNLHVHFQMYKYNATVASFMHIAYMLRLFKG